MLRCEIFASQEMQMTLGNWSLGVGKYDHITPTLRDELHWPPVTQRITLQLCLTVYKALHGMTYSYIAEFCRPLAVTHYRSRLRSATYGDLIVSGWALTTESLFGQRSGYAPALNAHHEAPHQSAFSVKVHSNGPTLGAIVAKRNPAYVG